MLNVNKGWQEAVRLHHGAGLRPVGGFTSLMAWLGYGATASINLMMPSV
ncbi:hypothetical protein H4N55_04630 [Aeromonas veronii]|nr:hypothetical protein [Aeromonas veronii]MBF3235902.1 hypothetical protein [Aeromonas veronii]